MKNLTKIVLLFAAISSSTPAKSLERQSKLFLVGGGLKSCSSLATKNCNTNILANSKQVKSAKTTSLYQISEKTEKLLQNAWPKNFQQSHLEAIIALTSTISAKEDHTVLSKSQLRSLLRKYDNKRIINKLNDAEYYLLLDLLEQPVLTADGKTRRREWVDLANSLNVFSNEIYHSFIALAKQVSDKPSPKILVITASARDPFEAVDFYTSAFSQAGGNTQWLPLDATLNTLIQQTGERGKVCQRISDTRLQVQGSANRESVYPDLTQHQLTACLNPKNILTAIEQADGIFINGGDQSLTAKAFINHDGSDSEALALIKSKLRNNTLVIGGTSAGTAVMSGGMYKGNKTSMITNGQSNAAVIRGAKKDVLPQEGCQKSNTCQQDVLNDDLTYNAKGGIGLFNWGILDTHFSERGRQGRLARLALDTNTRFAFGVDEATALVVSDIFSKQPNFTVMGQGGIFVVDNRLTSEKNNTVLTHYLTRDDSAKLVGNSLVITPAKWKKPHSEEIQLPKNINDIFQGTRYYQMAKLLCLTNNKQVSTLSTWDGQQTEIDITEQEDAMSSYGVITLQSVTKDYCSYQNYQMRIDNAQ